MHQTLVVSNVMGEDGQHHGVLWRKGKRGGVNMGSGKEESDRNEFRGRT